MHIILTCLRYVLIKYNFDFLTEYNNLDVSESFLKAYITSWKPVTFSGKFQRCQRMFVMLKAILLSQINYVFKSRQECSPLTRRLQHCDTAVCVTA